MEAKQYKENKKRKCESEIESTPIKRQQQEDGTYKHLILEQSGKYTADTLKRDFQNAIAIGNEKQALSSFFAGYDLEEIKGNEKSSKAVRTNFINRLVISILRYVSVANIPLCYFTLEVIAPMSKNKNIRSRNLLVKVIKAACQSYKTNLSARFLEKAETSLVDKQPDYKLHDFKDLSWFNEIYKKERYESVWKAIRRSSKQTVYEPIYNAYKGAVEKNKHYFLLFAITIMYMANTTDNGFNKYTANEIKNKKALLKLGSGVLEVPSSIEILDQTKKSEKVLESVHQDIFNYIKL